MRSYSPFNFTCKKNPWQNFWWLLNNTNQSSDITMGAILILFGNKITQQCRKITFSVGRTTKSKKIILITLRRRLRNTHILIWYYSDGNNRRHRSFFLQYYVIRIIWNDHPFIKLMMRCLTCRLLTIYFLFIGFTDWCWMKIFNVATGSKKRVCT